MNRVDQLLALIDYTPSVDLRYEFYIATERCMRENWKRSRLHKSKLIREYHLKSPSGSPYRSLVIGYMDKYIKRHNQQSKTYISIKKFVEYIPMIGRLLKYIFQKMKQYIGDRGITHQIIKNAELHVTGYTMISEYLLDSIIPRRNYFDDIFGSEIRSFNLYLSAIANAVIFNLLNICNPFTTLKPYTSMYLSMYDDYYFMMRYGYFMHGNVFKVIDHSGILLSELRMIIFEYFCL